MEEKRRYIAVAVTTEEALEICIKERVLLFCVENPIYSMLRQSIMKNEKLSDYEFDDHEDKEILLVKKVRGEPRFDDAHYVPYYLPLTWEGWKS